MVYLLQFNVRIWYFAANLDSLMKLKWSVRITITIITDIDSLGLLKVNISLELIELCKWKAFMCFLRCSCCNLGCAIVLDIIDGITTKEYTWLDFNYFFFDYTFNTHSINHWIYLISSSLNSPFPQLPTILNSPLKLDIYTLSQFSLTLLHTTQFVH